ncbi:MAG: methyltransferase domain-containing protein [Lachnospiraceae bacterium]|nr:methyltransferase domain-containing protein [Lachnospiraceae bacterium]
MTELEEYYNKFDEEKRLGRRHGQVEYITAMKYIHEYLAKFENPKIFDIGAGTGRYCVALANEGYDVSAIELVKHNLGILKAKNSTVKARQGTALNLKKYEDNSFDLTLLFGPMYHLFSFEDKLKALTEAKRVTRPGGYIMVAYCMNEYSVLTYGFKENNIKACIEEGKLDDSFHVVAEMKDLYDYVRIEDIDKLNEAAGLKRDKIISTDGPANYIRQILREMDDETFEMFMKYHLSTCERADLLGAGAHTMDILQV